MISAPIITDMIESCVRASLATLRSPMHAAVILYIATNGKKGASQIANSLGLDPSSVSTAMTSLTASKLIFRDKEKHRVTYSLTPEGEKIVTKMLKKRKGGQA